MILDKVMKASALALIATPLSLLIPNISFAAPAGTTFECRPLSDSSGSTFATFANVRPNTTEILESHCSSLTLYTN